MIYSKSGREIEANHKIYFGQYSYFFLEDFLEFLHLFLSLSEISILKFLKEFCQEDFALFRQFCADVISTWYLTPYTKCFCRVIKKISSKFYHGSLSNFLGDYCTRSTQTVKKLACPLQQTTVINKFRCLNICSLT